MKEKELKKSNTKGITLIALIITIIVMLILVGVTINIAINGGLFANAKKAKTDTQNALNAENELSEGKVNIDGKIYNSIDEYLGSTRDYKPASELFDASKETLDAIKDKNNFTTDGKLHIGDFINYNAGTWTEDEIKGENGIKVGPNNNLVTATNDKELPKNAFEFGGFATEHSRNENAKPCDDSYDYVKDESRKKGITGWRLFDVDEENNTITLISAGCPEDYYHPDLTNGAYISEYILSGYENSIASGLNLSTSYTKRNWEKYVNKTQHAIKANAITKTNLDNWYSKYTGVSSANIFDDNDTFRKIYETRYENLIDNYSHYWLASAANGYYLYVLYPDGRDVHGSCGYAFGIRVLVNLSSNIQLSKNGDRTVSKIDNDAELGGKSYTYNVWNIQ